MQNINALLVLFHHIADCLEAGKPQIKPKPKDKTFFFFFSFSIAALFALLLIQAEESTVMMIKQLILLMSDKTRF